MTDSIHIVLDETAMVAAGGGNRLASGIIDRANSDAGWHLYAPAATLVEADRIRPGTAEHLAAIPALIVVDLNLPAALALGKQDTWAPAHAEFAALPTPEMPDGALIATTDPGRWDNQPVRLLDLNP